MRMLLSVLAATTFLTGAVMSKGMTEGKANGRLNVDASPAC